ncbi:GNAT family N-acetyltransferase [Marivibrio halodurans]|uniref:GNAT family N-acetyltransferase n=1 Tax=Marivibrio halodurans TaxID=2039722 RepID=A0A8J7SJC6_9PROT|nr:GNAT family N-acetyltransferase [Marivibrio halodurans]MBP5857648.1 GNAT family N-acetyltransferase [Marivibrio halodurans]
MAPIPGGGLADEPTRLGFEDLQALLNLSTALDWPHTEVDWRTILLSGIVYGVRAEGGGLGAPILACAALFPYGEGMCALGMVMVASGARRRGLGRRVVERCLAARPHDGVPVLLASTVEGEPLYRRLGFATVGRLEKLLHDGPLPTASPALPAGWRLGPHIAMADLIPVLRLDRRVFGGARDGFLKHRISQAAGAATLFDAAGRLAGYGLAVRQGDLLILGPIAADDDRAALALSTALAAGHEGPLRIDVPAGHTALSDGLQGMGFRVADRPPLMARGMTALPAGGWAGYAAIAAQAFL